MKKILVTLLVIFLAISCAGHGQDSGTIDGSPNESVIPVKYL
jgi:hypothetical protein